MEILLLLLLVLRKEGATWWEIIGQFQAWLEEKEYKIWGVLY